MDSVLVLAASINDEIFIVEVMGAHFSTLGAVLLHCHTYGVSSNQVVHVTYSRLYTGPISGCSKHG